MPSVLIIASASDHWTLNDGTKHPTGVWAEELLAPYDVFSDAHFDITIATPDAKAPSIDPQSLSIKGMVLPHQVKHFKKRLEELSSVLNNPVDVQDVNQSEYDIVFYPGGHGPMEDLAHHKASGALLRERLASGGLLGLLCHSPAALLATADEDGNYPIAGKALTGLSNAEETLNGLAKKAPWLLEDRLKQAGADYRKGLVPFTPFTVRDGNLITGQNPQSSKKLANQLVEAL